jgi:hypothetical protein
MERKTSHLSLRLDPAVRAAAEKAASEDRRSVSNLIEVLLADRCKAHMPRAEDSSLPAMKPKKSARLDIFAHGGPEVTTRSRFMKSSDVFRTGIERNSYNKSGKTGELSKPAGDKSEKAVRPHAAAGGRK